MTLPRLWPSIEIFWIQLPASLLRARLYKSAVGRYLYLAPWPWPFLVDSLTLFFDTVDEVRQAYSAKDDEFAL